MSFHNHEWFVILVYSVARGEQIWRTFQNKQAVVGFHLLAREGRFKAPLYNSGSSMGWTQLRYGNPRPFETGQCSMKHS
jgi:hypothetical protein